MIPPLNSDNHVKMLIWQSKHAFIMHGGNLDIFQHSVYDTSAFTRAKKCSAHRCRRNHMLLSVVRFVNKKLFIKIRAVLW